MLNEWLEADRGITASQWAQIRVAAMCLLLSSSLIPRTGPTLDLPSAMLLPDHRLGAGPLLGDAVAPFVRALPYGLVALAVLVAFGVAPRANGLLLGFGSLAGLSLVYASGGKIVHMQWVPYTIIVLSITVWGARRPNISPRLVMAWIIGWGVFTSGLGKALGRWLDPSFSAVELRMLAFAGGADTSGTMAGTAVDALSRPVIVELLDIATVVLELSLILLVFKTSWFRAGLAAMMVLHLGIWQVLGISFAGVLPAYLPFIAEWLPRDRRLNPLVVVPFALAALFAIAADHADTTDWVLATLGTPQLWNQGVLLLLVAVVAALLRLRLGSGAPRRSARPSPA